MTYIPEQVAAGKPLPCIGGPAHGMLYQYAGRGQTTIVREFNFEPLKRPECGDLTPRDIPVTLHEYELTQLKTDLGCLSLSGWALVHKQLTREEPMKPQIAAMALSLCISHAFVGTA